MGMFEQLLVNKLQKQQHRIQFCDIVIQAQGVSVPVHSSVLSAFSPRLCEYLSDLPALPEGKSRVIELEAVEGRTLLGLVRWLYTGTIEGEDKDLQRAAEKLGITVFQDRGVEDERRGVEGEARRTNGSGGKRGNTRWDEEERRAKRRGCKDAETQTEGGEKCAVDTGTQTDLDITSSQNPLCLYNSPDAVDLPSAMPPLDTFGQLPWVTEGCLPVSANEATLLTVTGNSVPVELPCTVDESMVRQLMGTVDDGTPEVETTLFLPAAGAWQGDLGASTGIERVGNAAVGEALEGGSVELVEGFEQFEGNIPEFISYFLDMAGPRGRGRRRRRAAGGGKRERRPRGGKGGGGGGAGVGTPSPDKAPEEKEKQKVEKMEKVERRFPLRQGRAADIMWRGVGGGRTGAWLHLPLRKKSRGKPYSRQTSVQGKAQLGQEKAPAIRRTRGRSRKHPLPMQSLSSLPETDCMYQALPQGPLSPTMMPTLPFTPAHPRYNLGQLLFDLNQPSCAGVQQEDRHYTHMPTSTTSPSMPRSVDKAGAIRSLEEGDVRGRVQGEGMVMDSFTSLLMSLDESLVRRSYTNIKDPPGSCPRGRTLVSKGANSPQSAGPPGGLPQQRGLKTPSSRGRGRDWDRLPRPKASWFSSSEHKTCSWTAKVKDEKKKSPTGQEETALKEEMFEERRMTRTQAKRLRENPIGAPAAAAEDGRRRNTAPGKLERREQREVEKEEEEAALCRTPPRRISGKNMTLLRQKLLGRRKDRETAEGQSTSEEESEAPPPSPRKRPRRSVVSPRVLAQERSSDPGQQVQQYSVSH